MATGRVSGHAFVADNITFLDFPARGNRKRPQVVVVGNDRAAHVGNGNVISRAAIPAAGHRFDNGSGRGRVDRRAAIATGQINRVAKMQPLRTFASRTHGAEKIIIGEANSRRFLRNALTRSQTGSLFLGSNNRDDLSVGNHQYVADENVVLTGQIIISDDVVDIGFVFFRDLRDRITRNHIMNDTGSGGNNKFLAAF